jgi:2-polyprenyl-6-methoxyphenol hydroxylase-like FAD-dependent oxidoreductase
MKTQVLIVGAGPTGLALAAQLIRYCVDFIIVDKKETTTPHSRAIGVQARTLEIYEQIGMADNLIERGWIANKVRLVEGGAVRGEINLTDIGRGMSAYPFLLIVEQGLHEKLLYEFVRSNGHDVRWQTELESCSQDSKGVVAKVKNSAGESEMIDAQFLVGCDGAHSFVRHSLGLKFEGGTFERLFYVADVDIDWAYDHDALHACLAKNTVTAFFPMKGDRQWRIVGTFPEGYEGKEGEVLYEEIERQIIADTELKLDITKVNWFSVYKVHSRHVNKFSEGHSFLAGDSAHIHTPAGAQGMNTGIQDGYNLAWKLAAVLKGNADAKLLDTYNEERLPNAHRLLQTTDRFFQFGASDDWFVSFLRTNVFPYIANFAFNLEIVKNAIFPLVSQIGINYRGSSLSVGGDGFTMKAGDRMPYFLVEGTNIYDRLRDPKYHLLVFSDGTTSLPEINETFDGLADSHTFPLYPNIAEIFGSSKTFTVLLRPDNYIGYIASGNSIEGVKNYIRSQGSEPPA